MILGVSVCHATFLSSCDVVLLVGESLAVNMVFAGGLGFGFVIVQN